MEVRLSVKLFSEKCLPSFWMHYLKFYMQNEHTKKTNYLMGQWRCTVLVTNEDIFLNCLVFAQCFTFRKVEWKSTRSRSPRKQLFYIFVEFQTIFLWTWKFIYKSHGWLKLDWKKTLMLYACQKWKWKNNCSKQ